MRLVSLTSAVVLAASIALSPTDSLAQRTGRAAPKAPEGADFAKMSLPTTNVLKERANIAAFVLEKAKKIGLDATVSDSLKALATVIDARNACTLNEYEDLRSKVRADQNSGADETLEGRARVAMAGTAIKDLGKAREGDKAAVLALIPADKHEAVNKLIADQDEDFAKLAGGRRGGGGGRRP